MKKGFKTGIALLMVLALAFPAAPAAAADSAEDSGGFAETLSMWKLLSIDVEVVDLTHQMQGACTDGRYIWAGWNNRRIITRLDLTTWELETREYSEDDWVCNHVNDMTYNPNTNRLYVVAYDPNDNATRGDVAVFDPITLEFIELIRLTNDGKVLKINGIAYDRSRDEYIVSVSGNAGRRFAFLDADFQYLRTVNADRDVTLTIQGIETDGTYIYRSLWDFNVTNVIQVFDFEGRFVTQIGTGTRGKVLEVEDIMYDWSGNWYLNFSHRNGTGGSFYYTQLRPAADSSQFENMLGRISLPPNQIL